MCRTPGARVCQLELCSITVRTRLQVSMQPAMRERLVHSVLHFVDHCGTPPGWRNCTPAVPHAYGVNALRTDDFAGTCASAQRIPRRVPCEIRCVSAQHPSAPFCPCHACTCTACNGDGTHAAGVWEDARHAYLHETLVRRRGGAAALAVLYHGVLQQLFLDGAIGFGAMIDCRRAPLCAAWGGGVPDYIVSDGNYMIGCFNCVCCCMCCTLEFAAPRAGCCPFRAPRKAWDSALPAQQTRGARVQAL